MDFFVVLNTFEADSQLPFPWTPRVVNVIGRLIPERLEAQFTTGPPAPETAFNARAFQAEKAS